MVKRGRPEGSIIRLLDDPGRFEVAVAFAFTECFGWRPYHAARLATFLIASTRPITTESMEGVLLKSSMTHSTTIAGHEDRLRRKIPEVVDRANEREWAWLTMSSSLIFALVKCIAEGNSGGLHLTLKMLRQAGWSETLDRVAKRIDSSLRGNFPPAEGPLSRTAARLLRQVRQTAV
jgi:hypothetical protein